MSRLRSVRLVPKSNPSTLQRLEYGIHVFQVQCEIVDFGAGAASQLRVGYSRWILRQHEVRRPDTVFSKSPPMAIDAPTRLRQSQRSTVEVETRFQIRNRNGDVGEYSWQ